MKTITNCILVILLVGIAVTGCQGYPAFVPPGPNVAQGKSYTYTPTPSYSLTTDPNDTAQLTDGKLAPNQLADAQDANSSMIWWHKETVGWQAYGPPVVVTIDLMQDTPIAGVAISMGAGFAGVRWPPAILVAVSQDNVNFELVGDLEHLSIKYGVRPDTGRYVFATDEMPCHGRYVRFVIPPMRCTFCDEIKVYKGPDSLLTQPFPSEPMNDVDAWLAANLVPYVVRNWVDRDLCYARDQVAASSASSTVKNRVLASLATVETSNNVPISPPGDSYRAIFPLSSAHSQLFAALGDLRSGEGKPRLELWKNNRWSRMSLRGAVPSSQTQSQLTLNVRMLRGERRADTINVVNNTTQDTNVDIWFEGLPGGAAPSYISVREAKYVAMQHETDMWDANALPEASFSAGRWHVTVPAGVSSQLWIAFSPDSSFTPGTYAGTIKVQSSLDTLQTPVSFTVENLPAYPSEHTLAFTMWDYTGSGGAYGIKSTNVSAAIAHMQSYGYNVPWLVFFPFPNGSDFDANDDLINMPDWSVFDAWMTSWTGVRYYACVPGGGIMRSTYAGATVGTDQWKRRVASVMRAWKNHIISIGKNPNSLMILTIDEPHTGDEADKVVLWANTIRAAVPEFKHFADASSDQPQIDFADLSAANDILCPLPHRYDKGGQAAKDFYNGMIAAGHELWFYNCAGGPAQSNAYPYFRGQEWRLWAADGTGTAFWSYGDVGRSPGGSWNSFAATGTIYTPVYIDATSVTDGKHWLAIVEGIEDYEYLKMLSDRVKMLEAAGIQSQALTDAKNLLAALPASVIAAGNSGDMQAYDNGREQVLDMLLQLR